MHCSLNELEDAALTFPVLFQDVIYQVISMHRKIYTFLFCLTYEFLLCVFVIILFKEREVTVWHLTTVWVINCSCQLLRGGLCCIRNIVEHFLLPLQRGNVGHGFHLWTFVVKSVWMIFVAAIFSSSVSPCQQVEAGTLTVQPVSFPRNSFSRTVNFLPLAGKTNPHWLIVSCYIEDVFRASHLLAFVAAVSLAVHFASASSTSLLPERVWYLEWFLLSCGDC